MRPAALVVTELTQPDELIRASQRTTKILNRLLATSHGVLGDANIHPQLTGGDSGLQIGLLPGDSSYLRTDVRENGTA